MARDAVHQVSKSFWPPITDGWWCRVAILAILGVCRRTRSRIVLQRRIREPQTFAEAIAEAWMPRRLRIHLPGGFYHVTLRGNHQQAIFFAECDRTVLNIIVARKIERLWRTSSRVLLDGRITSTWWCRLARSHLSSPMRQIASEYARAMQVKLETTGHFFERRYHAILVDADSYLMELLRYVHLNPVRARLVRDASQYQWSSHHVYIGVRSEPWVTTGFCLNMFGSDQETRRCCLSGVYRHRPAG